MCVCVYVLGVCVFLIELGGGYLPLLPRLAPGEFLDTSGPGAEASQRVQV